MDIRQKIGRRIAYLRTQKNISQQQLAEAAGITPNHVSRIENGRYGVTIDILSRLLKAMNAHLEIKQD